MKFKQLSLFLENKPAHLKHPCDVLAKADINILTLCLADAEQFGILRLIVADWEEAKAALESAGCVVRVDEVIALEVPDQPGGLANVLNVIEQGGHNLEYMYAFTFGRVGRAVLFMRFEDTDGAIATLQSGGINVLDPVEFLPASF